MNHFGMLKKNTQFSDYISRNENLITCFTQQSMPQKTASEKLYTIWNKKPKSKFISVHRMMQIDWLIVKCFMPYM